MKVLPFLTLSIVALVYLTAASPAQARTWNILPDGSGDAPTVQAAIDSADNGDVIELADGIYTGDGNRDLNNSEKWFLLRSQSGNPEACIIDCQGSPTEPHRGIIFSAEG